MGAMQFFLSEGDLRIEAFVYGGFFNKCPTSSLMHSHRSVEVHITERGKCSLYIDGDEYDSSVGTVIAIPAGVKHMLKIDTDKAVHHVVHVNYPLEQVTVKKIIPAIIEELGEYVRAYNETQNFYPIAACLSFICKDLFDAKCRLTAVTNRDFIILEFFENKYNQDVKLIDLAAKLNVCPKQCSRLVRKCMNASFKDTLTKYRLEAAEQLLRSDPSLTTSEIAEMVGYRSYSALWKSLRRSSDLQ